MAAFSHQQHQTVFFPNPNTTAASFPQFQPHHHAFHANHHDQVANNLQSPESSMSMVLDDHKVGSGKEFLAKKRKDRQMFSHRDQSKDTSNKLIKKHKKNNSKKGFSDQEDTAVGYIHVRARRGQATDSHSLAERVRREKISERMKLLQTIVPGCDKVTGKALMLDEIINYVQSLQNQVELASVNPMLYDFGVDLDTFMLKPDENMSNMVLPIMPSVQQCNHNGGDTTFAPATDNYNYLPQLINGSAATNSQLFQQEHMPNILSQGNEHELWDVDEQRLKLDSRFALSNNLTSFQ